MGFLINLEVQQQGRNFSWNLSALVHPPPPMQWGIPCNLTTPLFLTAGALGKVFGIAQDHPKAQRRQDSNWGLKGLPPSSLHPHWKAGLPPWGQDAEWN